MDRFVEMRWPYWRWGMPAPIWITEAARIREMIDRLDLKPIDEKFLPYEAFAAPGLEASFREEARERVILRKIPFPGGLKIAHLHHGEHIYQLDNAQWREFSKNVIEGFQKKLGAAGRVNVRELTALSETMEAL